MTILKVKQRGNPTRTFYVKKPERVAFWRWMANKPQYKHLWCFTEAVEIDDAGKMTNFAPRDITWSK